ncbi:MAG: hypothetical protein AAF456_12800 [Planctomycetota bacterium]
MKQRIPVLVTVFLTWAICAASAAPADGQATAEQIHQRATDEALREYHRALDQFQRTMRLVESGSASQSLLRQHRHEKDMASLAHQELVSPDQERNIACERARLSLRLSLDEYEVVRSLFRRGSASELELRRARTRLEVDDLKHRHLTDNGDPKMLAYEISLAKFELAEFEFESAERLFRTGTISRSIYSRVAGQFREARRDLDGARRNLGADESAVDL